MSKASPRKSKQLVVSALVIYILLMALDTSQNVAKKHFMAISSLFDKRDTGGGPRDILDGI